MIPNNVDLENKHLLRSQLEAYQMRFRQWWKDRGPFEFLDMPMRIRSPKNGDSKDWAEYKEVSPADYRWGIFVSSRPQQFILFGDHRNEKVWRKVPSDYHKILLEHIVTQADAENGSIEQAKILSQTAPSLHDLNNLFQFLLEEGRHSWAMVHILLEHFGHDGLVESDRLFDRISGDKENPRILNAFNEPIHDWMSHFIFCFLSDRNGKYQLDAITRGAFAPLAESSQFMLLEEPLHISMGAMGLLRILHKSTELTLKYDRYDIFQFGAIPLPIIQKYFNYWIPIVYDLFGHDESERAYLMYEIGVRSARDFDQYLGKQIKVDRSHKGGVQSFYVNPEKAINCIMRQQFIREVEQILNNWNKKLKAKSIDFSLKLPHERFNRKTGPCKDFNFNFDGTPFTALNYQDYLSNYLPSNNDILEVQALMKQTLEPGKCASWISPFSLRL